MTANQINARKAREEERANRESERIERRKDDTTRRGQNMKFAGDIMNAIGGAAKTAVQGVGVSGAARTAKRSLVNDPQWYIPTDQQAKDVASFSFNAPLGAPYPSAYTGTNDSAWTQRIDPISGEVSDVTVTRGSNKINGVDGILTMEVILGMGLASDEAGVSTSYASARVSDAIQQAQEALYTFVRHKNSGSKNYDPVDLFLYIMAVSEVYAFLCEGIRMYGCAQLYSSTNRYANILADALKFNGEDVRSNLANFRAGINSRLARFSQLALPKTMPLVNRRVFMFSEVFQDDEATGKNPFYAFTPKKYHRFQIDTDGTFGDAGAGALIAHQVPYNRTVKQYFTMLDEMLDSLLIMEDIGTMSGDILKAYGPENLVKVSPISEDYAVAISTDKLALHQFRNATFCPLSSDAKEQGSIGQVDGKFVWWIAHQAPMLKIGEDSALTYGLAPSHLPIRTTLDPTPENIIEMTRLTTMFIPVQGGESYNSNRILLAPYTCGTEVVTDVRMWMTNTSLPYGELDVYTVEPWYFVGVNANITAGDTLSGAQVSTLWKRLSQFEYAPVIHVLYTYSDGTTITPAVIGDMDNYRFFTYEELNRINSMAVQGLLNFPDLAIHG